jgi:uncharacterized LabA/DUF88 family protein
MTSSPTRVVYFFDGFNFFHSINEHDRTLLWLDYVKLARVLTPKSKSVEKVVLFTAYATWKPASCKRHKLYLSALRAKGIEIVWGKFYKKPRTCHKCHQTFNTHEEKQTDVNLAVNLLSWAIKDKFDEIVLGTADSDLIPAILAMNDLFPEKNVKILFPIGRNSIDLRALPNDVMTTKEKTLKSCQLPNDITLLDGKVVSRLGLWT